MSDDNNAGLSNANAASNNLEDVIGKIRGSVSAGDAAMIANLLRKGTTAQLLQLMEQVRKGGHDAKNIKGITKEKAALEAARTIQKVVKEKSPAKTLALMQQINNISNIKGSGVHSTAVLEAESAKAKFQQQEIQSPTEFKGKKRKLNNLPVQEAPGGPAI